MRHEKAAAVLDLARRLAASAEGLTLEQMAAAAGASRRTAERMRDAVESLFPQLEAVSEGAVKRWRIPGGLDGFLQAPSREELAELALAAAALREAGHSARAAMLETLEQKVRAALKGAFLRRLTPDLEALARAERTLARPGPRPVDDPQTLAAIRYAVMSMRAVRFRYVGGSSPGRLRTVCPYGVIFERVNYLVGAPVDESAAGGDAPRNWRLDRISDLVVTDTAASPPPGFNLDDYVNRSFGVYQGGREAVALRIAPEAADEARAWRFHADQTITEEDDGSVIVRFEAAGMLELAWHLFTWGDKAAILAPEALKAEMSNALAAAMRAQSWR